MKNRLLLTFFLGLLSFYTYAQLTVSGEIRPRAEYRHGFKTLATEDQDAAFFTDQRTRLNLGFAHSTTEIFVSLQDVRVWGDQPQLVIDQGASTGIHQAWANVRFDDNWAMKLGRQELAYDDHRILGNVGWAQQARSHDAALFMYRDSSFTAHVGLAFNQSSAGLASTRYTISNNYKAMQFLWLHKDWNAISGSFLFLNNGRQVDFADGEFETNFTQTIGGRLSYKEGDFGANFAAYYQGGTNADTLDTDVNAYYLGADIAYNVSKEVTLGAGAEILSGNDQLDSENKQKAFAPLYGTNHKFNGLMDYFYVGNHGGSVGLNDLFIKGIYKKKSFNAQLVLHYFLTNADLAAPEGGAMDSYLGTEMDIVLGTKLTEGAALKLGYSQLFASETMEVLKGGDRNATNNWVWAMVTVNPSFKIGK